jgi:hypothetical protein
MASLPAGINMKMSCFDLQALQFCRTMLSTSGPPSAILEK